ncbi:MAG: ABC transporter ATP-binding protein [Gemmatimonadota bacterium]|nr:ABC transporter ATP-binding protein [Gemmatimonadota bacterium]MDH4349066.1 ABC transporter ATP-binding protein [Gemmatimonadota bacterium]MDH5282499.1 ABC transporter ATP-binding protein [Gemmatimonadota bacterium]
MTLLQLDNVTKRFGGVTAVDAISCTIDRGEVVGFLGPNGAGKSTTMRMITQYHDPDGGRILFDGTPLSEAGREAKRRLGYLPENNPLYPDMLVEEYLAFIGRLRDLRGAALGSATDEAVAATGVAAVYRRPIGELSKGFRQRVGLAAAILHRPDLLVLDEPTEGLDPNQRVEIRRLITQLGRDRTVLLSTHILPEVQHTCTRLLIINQGRLAADGPVGDLISRAGGRVQITVEVEGGDVVARLEAIPGVESVAVQSTPAETRVRVRLTAVADRDLRPEVYRLAREAGWTLYELHLEAGSLEDLFRQLTVTGEAA